jgi:uncharacterized protein (TIGR01319 family)
MKEGKYTLITDIGSTTTKAILIDRDENRLLALEHADTTVEAPYNDVKIGVYNAVKELERQSTCSLLAAGARADNLKFNPDIQYLSTSSAGGGLQILVVGLTLFDSASSAKRAAYGAGGIILDVFAIDDKRSSVEQMMAMRNLRPDMILLSGGTDGGAITSVLRLAEILRIAKPMPKFSTSVKIPTLYAGNSDVIDMVKTMISQDFDLHILPNLRPTLNNENLRPTQEKIQELFMANVMERAPGYSALKSVVDAPILPTPGGVMQSLSIIDRDEQLNMILFDIGGATTDVFTRINGHFQRTVSANLGMSYSALNVMKESEAHNLRKLLPDTISESEIRNYIGNKTLYPTGNPKSKNEYRIEHALAKCAIKHSFVQHQQMHYNSQKIGYLDALKNSGKDKYEEKFNYVVNEESHYFFPSDIGLLIGAGGVFAHAQHTNQCLDILIAGFKPTGITELAIDKHFITPHLGVLSQVNDKLAKTILRNDCLESLAIYIRPIFPPKKGITVLQLEFEDQQRSVVAADTVQYFSAKPGRRVKIIAQKKCMIDGSNSEQTVETDLPIIVDTRFDLELYDPQLERLLNLFPEDAESCVFGNPAIAKRGSFCYDVELPYPGDIMFQVGNTVAPDDIVAQNRYNPPRLFVVSTNPQAQAIPKDVMRQAIPVKPGDEVNFSEVLRHPIPELGFHRPHFSPVRGKVEFVDHASGNVVLSEIQNYSKKPVVINLADKLGVKPKQAARYVTRNVGDFVYEGDTIARSASAKLFKIVASPTTGQVVDIDRKAGLVTVHFKSNPYLFPAHVTGVVERVEENKAIRISYSGIRLDAAIGWGKPVHGTLLWKSLSDDQDIPEHSIVALAYKPSKAELIRLCDRVTGLICPALDEADVAEYIGNEPGVINTGQEVLPASLVLLQGFGDLTLTSTQADFLKEHSGKLCMLDPHTRIRAGVVRACINIME